MAERKEISVRPIEARQDVKETDAYLPQEIINEILVRLPVKSLMRFKRVSKPWLSVISSNWFIKAHLDKSSENKSFEHHRIIFEESIVHAKQCFSPSFLSEPMATALNLGFPLCASTEVAHIIGSCNGMVCILKRFVDFILWNPTTRKFKKLPPVFGGTERGSKTIDSYGFGFDESSDDYKVFCKWGDFMERERVGSIYSLKTDSWRTVDDDSGVLDSGFSTSGIYASGKLHWVVFRSNRQQLEIVYFDLEREIFGTMEWPCGHHVNGGTLWNAVDGGLSCSCHCVSDTHDYFDYWRLKEDNSWYKFGTLDCPRHCPTEYFQPLFEGPGGEVLGWNESWYAVLSKESSGDGHVFTPKRVHNLKTMHPAIAYVESLAPFCPTAK